MKAGDFIPKINDTFVHSVAELKLVDAAYAKNEPVPISFVRWLPATQLPDGVLTTELRK